MTSASINQLSGFTSSQAIKAPCKVATTANIAFAGVQTIDGVSVNNGDRVLVRAQSNAVENGIYIVGNEWLRAKDFDSIIDVLNGTLILVNQGTLYGDTLWKIDNDIGAIGSTPITFQELELGGGGIGSINPVSFVGINTTASLPNRLSVSSSSILFNHDGEDIRVNLNKAAPANNCSFIFQTGFSGRAEFGLTGTDDFTVRVSPDGTTFTNAIVVDKDDASVSFPNTTFVSGQNGLRALAFLNSVSSSQLNSNSVTTTKIVNKNVTLAKMADGTANRLLGYDGSGVASVVSLGAGLSLSGGVLSATGVVANLDALSDVVITAPSNGQVLLYNGTNWVNNTVAGGGVTVLNDLTDVIISTPASGDVLKYNGTNWVNDTIAGGGFGGSFSDLDDVTVTPSSGIDVSVFTIPTDERIQFVHNVTQQSPLGSITILKDVDYSGGTAGVESCLYAIQTVSNGAVAPFQWAVLGAVRSEATAGENVGVYGQAWGLVSNHGPLWGVCTEARERVDAQSSGALHGIEIGVFGASGANTNRNRIGAMVVAGKGDDAFASEGFTASETWAGLYLSCFGGNNSGYYKNGIHIGNDPVLFPTPITCDNGIRIITNGSTGIWDSGEKTVGCYMAGAYTGSAFRMNQGQVISYTATDSVIAGFNGSYISQNRSLEIYGNAGSVPAINITSGGGGSVSLIRAAAPCSWAFDAQDATVNAGLLRGQAFELAAGGLLRFKSNGIYSANRNLRFGGFNLSGRAIVINYTDETGVERVGWFPVWVDA